MAHFVPGCLLLQKSKRNKFYFENQSPDMVSVKWTINYAEKQIV